MVPCAHLVPIVSDLSIPILYSIPTVDTRGYAKHTEEGFVTKELHSGDVYPLSYSATPQIQKLKHTRLEYNSQGFGAAGLPPLTFSHLNRNWNLYSVFLQNEDMFSVKPPSEKMEEDESGSRSWYGPGVSLSKFPKKRMRVSYSSDEEQHMELDLESGGLEEWDIDMEQERGDVTFPNEDHEPGGEDKVPASKIQRLMSSLVTIPTDQVKRHSGGKGRTRFRLRNRAGWKLIFKG